MSLLAALAATASPEPLPDPPPAQLPANVNLVFEGNSISNGYPTGTTMAGYVAEALGTEAANGAAFTSVAQDGHNWTMLLANHADVDAAWDPDADYNVLVVGEDTNSVNTDRTFSQIRQDARDYYAAVTAAHPWIILMWGSVPQSVGTTPQILSRNANLVLLNDYWRENWESEGLAGWVDMRADCAMYNHDGSSYAYFSAYAAGWAESDPSFTIHPAAGALDNDLGLRAIARRIAVALRSIEWPA